MFYHTFTNIGALKCMTYRAVHTIAVNGNPKTSWCYP